jgi:hypothetical protein
LFDQLEDIFGHFNDEAEFRHIKENQIADGAEYR